MNKLATIVLQSGTDEVINTNNIVYVQQDLVSGNYILALAVKESSLGYLNIQTTPTQLNLTDSLVEIDINQIKLINSRFIKQTIPNGSNIDILYAVPTKGDIWLKDVPLSVSALNTAFEDIRGDLDLLQAASVGGASHVTGCTDPLYVEYDALATDDDGSCVTLI
jgi:hypothetical protein